MPDFSDVAAAWSVLSDPKERLRYDRSLKAKELADNMGSLIDTGFDVAVPFLFKTAPQQINKTASDIGKTLFDVGERLDKARTETEQRLGRARKVAGFNKKSGDMARTAVGEIKRAEALKARLYSDRRLEVLKDTGMELTSAQARQILKGFDYLLDSSGKSSNSSAKDSIDSLAQVEGEHKEKTSTYQSMRVSLSEAEEKMEAARHEKEISEKCLEEGYRRLEEAQAAREKSERNHTEAIRQENQVATKLDVTQQNMDSARQDEQVAKEQLDEARRKFEVAQVSRQRSEQAHNEAGIEREQASKSLDTAKQREGSARLDQQLAENQLEENRRTLEKAQVTCEQSQNNQKGSVLQEKAAATSLDKALVLLKTAQFEARRALRQAEGLNTSKENSYLKNESERLEDLAAKLRVKAEKLKAKAEEIKAEAG